MNQIGEENRIPVINVAEADVGLLLGLPVTGLLGMAVLGFDALALPAMALGLTIAVALVYASPAQLNTLTWLRDLGRYYLLRPRMTVNVAADSDRPGTAGGAVSYTPFEPDERAQDLTNIQRAWPGAGAVERDDGTMEAFVEVRPANMDFAMSGDWASVQTAAQEFANKELDHPLTFYATTRSFPVERLVDQLEQRQSDPDVTANPTFGALLEEYRDRRPDDLADTNQLRYYLGVEVDRLDVYNQYEREQTPGERLTEFPVLGVLAQPFVTRRRDLTEPELRAAMFEQLDERIRTLRTEFIENVSGWSATRLSTLELFVLSTDFWQGGEHDSERIDRLLRERETLSCQSRGEAS